MRTIETSGVYDVGRWRREGHMWRHRIFLGGRDVTDISNEFAPGLIDGYVRLFVPGADGFPQLDPNNPTEPLMETRFGPVEVAG